MYFNMYNMKKYNMYENKWATKMGKKDFILFRKVNQLLFFNKFKLRIVYFDIFLMVNLKNAIIYILYIIFSPV